MPEESAPGTQVCIRTLRLKVKPDAYSWLNAAATEINQVWNFANATSEKAARPFAGRGKWLSAFDLDKLTAGASACFERIQSDSIQRVNAEFVTRRRQFKKTHLRREQTVVFNRAAEPGTSPAQGKEQRGEGGGMNTGISSLAVRRAIGQRRHGNLLARALTISQSHACGQGAISRSRTGRS
jgi:hypothetical protein